MVCSFFRGRVLIILPFHGVYCADLPGVDTGNAFCPLLLFQCCVLLMYVCRYYNAKGRQEEEELTTESSTVAKSSCVLVNIGDLFEFKTLILFYKLVGKGFR